MLDAGDATKKNKDLLRTKHYGQDLGQFRSRDQLVEPPIFFESYLVEEAKRRNGDMDRARRQLSFISQINLVCTNVLGPYHLR